jgi:K+-transporting ATPase ATPase A chain
MTINGWLQIAVFFALVAASVKPLGLFLASVFDGAGRNFLSPILGPVERGFYAAAGVNATKEQGWMAYAGAMLTLNALGFLFLYGLLRLQGILPWNPQNLPGLTPDLAFNTAISFVTNTNWQSYGGESTMSYFSQMVGLTVQNFLSAATGMALAIALVRAFARSGAATIGNFWVDVTRATLYVLLPLSLLIALALVALGLPQTMGASVEATTLEGGAQTIAVGPVASQMAIKVLGTNGGGFFNANSSHPFENPNALTNLIQMWSILALSAGIVYAFGRMVGNTRQGWALLSAMAILLIGGAAIAYWRKPAAIRC